MTSPSSEWLEADGLGGFAFGRADGIRTRRYHAVLAVATTPPTGRVVLVNGFDAWVETADGRFALTSQRYTPDVTHPDGAARVTGFTRDPWPTWTFTLPNGLEVIQELVGARNAPMVALSWRLGQPGTARLIVQPYLSGRDVHALHHENATFRFDARVAGPRVTWQPYTDLPPVIALANGDYLSDPACTGTSSTTRSEHAGSILWRISGHRVASCSPSTGALFSLSAPAPVRVATSRCRS
jgi:glycogen debranching enzyme